MTHILEMAPVTTYIFTQLETLNFPVGDNSSPSTSYGWQGEPNAAATNFTPWMSLTAMTGQPQQAPTLDIYEDGGMWVLNYVVFHAAVNRTQTQTLADRVRNLLASSAPTLVTGAVASWSIHGVKCTNIGGTNRVGEATPYYYTETDSYAVLVSEG
jgi:hypothetical protein